MIDYIEHIFEKIIFKLTIWRIKKGWGANCENLDEEWYTDSGCGGCRAKKTIEFLEHHLDLYYQ